MAYKLESKMWLDQPPVYFGQPLSDDVLNFYQLKDDENNIIYDSLLEIKSQIEYDYKNTRPDTYAKIIFKDNQTNQDIELETFNKVIGINLHNFDGLTPIYKNFYFGVNNIIPNPTLTITSLEQFKYYGYLYYNDNSQISLYDFICNFSLNGNGVRVSISDVNGTYNLVSDFEKNEFNTIVIDNKKYTSKSEIAIVVFGNNIIKETLIYSYNIECITGINKFAVKSIETENLLHFLANDTFSLEGLNVKIVNPLGTFIYNTVDSFKKNNITCPLVNSKLLSKYWINGVQETYITCQEKTTTLKFCVDYYSNLNISIDDQVKTFYIDEPKNINSLINIPSLIENKKLSGKLTLVKNSIDNNVVYEEIEITKEDIDKISLESKIINPNLLDQTGQTSTSFPVKLIYITENKQEFIKDFEINVFKKVQYALVTEGVDTTIYYDTGTKRFEFPTIEFRRLYNDGTYSTIQDKYQLAFYTKKEALPKNEITEGTYIQHIKKIYVHDTVNDLWCDYDVNIIHDTIGYLNLPYLRVTYGTDYLSYKEYIYENTEVYFANSEITMPLKEWCLYDDFQILNNKTILENEDIIFNLVILGVDYVDLQPNKVNFLIPEISSIELKLNDFPLDYVNNSSIDLSVIKFKVIYENNFIEELSISDDRVEAKNDLIINGIIYDINLYKIKTETIQFEIKNKFDNTKIFTLSQDITLYNIARIKSISIKRIYNQYKVGDLFLNNEDNTIVNLEVTKLDINNNETSYTIENVYLKNGLSLLNINPIKSTEFKNAEFLTVRITYARDYSIYCEYSIKINPQNIETLTSKTHRILAVYLSADDVDLEVLDEKIPKDTYLLIKDFTYHDTVNDFDISDSDEELELLQSLVGKPAIYYDDKGIRKITKSERIDFSTQLNILKNRNYIVGYIEDLNNKEANGRIILYKDYVPIISNEGNITVKYPCYVKENAEYINKCKFGILFGNNNAKSRLFLSGNNEYSNCDWHSEEISQSFVNLKLNGNFSYFPDTSYCFYGENDNKIVGYDIVSNNKLLVLKDHSDKETSVYFRTPTLVTAIDGGGNALQGLNNSTLYQEEYSLIQGNSSVAGVSSNAIKNLNGDTLFISNENQIVGLDIEGIIGDNQRYANTRSYNIDKYIKNKNLTNSWLWTNNKDLYFVLEDEIFICNRDLKINNQYEWFRVNIPNIESIIEINNIKYYGTKNGELYKENDGYSDINKTFIGEGGVAVQIRKDDYVVYANKDYLQSLDKDKQYKFKINPKSNDVMYHKIANIKNTTENYQEEIPLFKVNILNTEYIELVTSDINILNNWFKIFNEDKYIYFNKIDDSKNVIQAKQKYKLQKYIYTDDDTKILYQIIDEENNVINPASIRSAEICYMLDEEYEIYDLDLEENKFKLLYNNVPVDIVPYNTANEIESLDIMAEIREYNNVECYYITKPYYFNNLNYNKTIYGWTLSNDTGIESWLEVTYVNNKIPYKNYQTLMKINVDKLGVDFNLMNFMKLDLEKNIVPRVSSNFRVLPNVNFICFGFKNNGSTNSVLCKMNITYTVSSVAYGSK